MKRTLIALGVAATVALPMTAQANPKLYGRLNLTVEQISDDWKQDDRYELVSNASRFGVRGESELTANLSAIYLIEWQVSGDGNATDLSRRNRFVGLKHKDFGAIKLGNYDTYVKLAQDKVDLFNDLNADMQFALAGENRVTNVIAYESPKFLGGLNVNVMVMPGEESGNKATPFTTTNANDDTGLADSLSASIVYDNKDLGLYAAVAMDKDVVSTFNAINTFATAPTYVPGVGSASATAGPLPATDKTDTLRAVLGYTIKDIGLTLNAMYQIAERSVASTVTVAPNPAVKVAPEETGYLLSAAYKFGEGWTAKAQYVAATTTVDIAGVPDIDITQTSLGLDYHFNSKTKAFGYYSLRNHSNDLNPAVATNGKTNDYDVSFFGIGMEHSF